MTRLVATARWAGRSALDLVFPPRCATCGVGGAFLCQRCADALTPAEPPRCDRCWRPDTFAGDCAHCQVGPPVFDRLRAAFVYQGVARDAVHALKYRGLTALAHPMASLMAVAIADVKAVDLVLPVPLSGLRRRTRGYNQAEALARALAHETSLPLETKALVRRKHTPPQARSADAQARRRNVEGAFEARAKLVGGARILVIDDVSTTGSTFGACAAALVVAGAASVSALAFARED